MKVLVNSIYTHDDNGNIDMETNEQDWEIGWGYDEFMM